MAKITFDNKVTLVSQPDIARENKVIADDINEIKSVVNNNAGVCDYSTSEINTGKTWTDGKPIYRKVINGNLPTLQPSGGGVADGNVAHNISNFETCTFISGDIIYQSVPYTLPVISSSGKITGIRTVNSTNIVIRSSDSWGPGSKVRFVIEYTKTS